MRLTPDVHLLGSGDSGFGLSDPYDCHVYLVDGGGEAALVDAGCGSGVDTVLGNADAAGIARSDIRYLLLTHAHPDHSGGAARLKALLPHLEVLASPPVAGWVGHADEDAMSLAAGKRAEFYPADYRFSACPVDRDLRDGDTVAVGVLELTCLETPGHAYGHLSYLCRGGDRSVLFCGDLLFYGGQISLENNWDCRVQDYAASLGKLSGLAVDALLPGHHSISLSRGQRHIDRAHKMFENGFVPRSVV